MSVTENETDQPDGPAARPVEPSRPGRSGRSRGVRGWVRRHKALSVLAGLLALLLVVLLALTLWFNNQLGGIPRVTIEAPNRPPAATDGSMNILLTGADNGDDGDSVADDLADGTWTPGSHRSDTLIVMHLTPDRKQAYLVSIPRDTYTEVAGHGMQKINAAFSLGGPSLAVQSVESFTGLRMDHTAIIDWNGFRDLSDALGGVRVYISETTASQKGVGGEWVKGWTTLKGDRALRYVRTRYGLENGDYDRIQRQQNFLRAALDQTASSGTLTDPLKFPALIKSFTNNVTLDSGLSNRELTALAFSVRGLRSPDITFVTAPMARFEDNRSGSVIIPDRRRTRELFTDVEDNDLQAYLTKYGDRAGTLGPETGIR